MSVANHAKHELVQSLDPVIAPDDINNFNRFWSVCGDLALLQAKGLQYFNEFSRVSVITQLEYSRNGRLCDLRFMCLRYADE